LDPGHLELKLQQFPPVEAGEAVQGWAKRANRQFRNPIERRLSQCQGIWVFHLHLVLSLWPWHAKSSYYYGAT
jgi:hypothetical protein